MPIIAHFSGIVKPCALNAPTPTLHARGEGVPPPCTGEVRRGDRNCHDAVLQYADAVLQYANAVLQYTDAVLQYTNAVSQYADAVLQYANAVLQYTDAVLPNADAVLQYTRDGEAGTRLPMANRPCGG